MSFCFVGFFIKLVSVLSGNIVIYCKIKHLNVWPTEVIHWFSQVGWMEQTIKSETALVLNKDICLKREKKKNNSFT